MSFVTTTTGNDRRSRCLRAIEALCRRVRRLNQGDGEPEVEHLLTGAHERLKRHSELSPPVDKRGVFAHRAGRGQG